MHSVQTRLWDPRPPSKHVSSFRAPPPSNSRHSHVTSATPAKRITFYKSGDNQFGGVRMAIHKRSFKCFDTLLDDLSQKVPLPFGVRTVTTPRGTHTIKQLEQLQDGGCYLCSDRRHAKPINLELASKRQGIWYNHARRPQRPEAPSTTPPGHMHLPYRQRRILLVKNSEPGMRRSIVLGRRSTRSLRAFLDEVSEVMQFHVRKLYTAEGRRIDSIQSLLTCPGVLVCVGREAFSPMLINFIRKTSEEILPGLSSKSPGLGPRTPGNGARSPATHGVRSPPHGAQSRGSEYDEGLESKKNVNFGLETKKSIIHPRADSSNRSARFSMSSEKSCGVFSQARPAIMNDDIEKRVLVNKDGSLSVEMRVRFRLQSDETLQWSTEIKKSPSLTSESCPLSQTQANYLQHGQSGSSSDPDSTGYECVDYNGRAMQSTMEDNHCTCCYQRQDHQFDLWENPAHSLKHAPVPPPHPPNHTLIRHTHSSSSSSSCNSRRVVRCRARLSQSPGGSGSEQSQLVQEEMCVTEQVERRVEVAEDGDTQVEVCKVSRCCSRTELVAMDTNLRPHSGRSAEGELMTGEDENRPFSAISSSSHVLQSLKEDQDDEDEDDDLPPSASQCSHRDEPSPTPVAHLDEKPKSRASANSVHSTKLKEREETGSRALSEASSCRCGAATPHSANRVPSTASDTSKSKIPKSEQESTADVEDEEIKRVVSGLSGHTGLSAISQKSGTSSVCPHCGGCKHAASSNGRASKRSDHSNRATQPPASPLCNKVNGDDEHGHDDKASDITAVSTQSNKSNLTNHGRLSAMSNVLEGRAASAMSRTSNMESTGRDQEERATSAASHTSNKSHKSGCNGLSGVKAELEEERSPSALSAQSNVSAKSGKSHQSKCTSEKLVNNPREEAEGENNTERAASSLSNKSGASVRSHKSSCSKVASPLDKTAAEEDASGKRAPSSLSVKSNTSAKSGASRRSTCSHCANATSPVGKAEEGTTNDATEREEGAGIEERAASAMSAKSNRSDKSCNSAKASERSPPRSEARGDGEERATSQMSGKLSVKSAKSSKSNENEKAVSPGSNVAEDAEESERPESTMSAKSENQNRSASARSGKSASSAKSRHENTELDGTVDRSPSATSGRSRIFAKSQKSNHPPASPNQDDTATPIIESNGEEMENENQERSESVTSAKSKSSARSGATRKSNSSRTPSSPNIVTIKTPEGADEKGNERAQSAASGNEAGENVNAPESKSAGSSGQTLSPKRTPSPPTRSPKTPAASPRSPQSPAQHLQPSSGVGETRGPSALSVHSISSAKSGRSKYCCGAASAFEKGEEGKDEEDKEDGKSEGAASFLSSKRQRKESGGTEKPLSRASSGSMSLGLPEDQDAADSDSGKSTVSFHKNTEATQSNPKNPESSVKNDTETTGSVASQRSNGKSSKSTSHNPIPTIEMPGGENGAEEGGEPHIERATSAVTVRSSRSKNSCCNCSSKSAAQMLESKGRDASPSPSKTGSVMSTSSTNTRKMDTINNRGSAMSGSTKSRSKSPASASVKDASVAKSCVSAKSDTENQDISTPTSYTKDKEDVAQNKADSVYSQSPCCLRPESATSTQSKSKKALDQSKGYQDSVKSECLSPAKSHKSSSVISSSHKEETPVKPSSPCPLHTSRPGSKVEACSESTLSHSLSAADLLKETMAAARQNSQQSKASKNNDKARSEKSDRSKKSRDVKDQEGEMELTPACLPNASPNEVVSDWLRSIPANTSLLGLGNELNEELEEQREKDAADTPGEDTTKVETPDEEEVEKDEKVESEEEGGKEDQSKSEAAEEEKSSGPGSGDAAGIPLSKNWHCSAAVMKVLLSSSPGRCQSMPEVSPVYGRRLSTSARGLLDCLAQLQLIEPATSNSSQEQKDRKQQYEEIMNILQSLWLSEPRDIEVKKDKDGGLEQATPPRSSSGVGMSSGSGGSGKENGNQGDEIPPKETELPLEEEVAAKVAEEDKGDAQAKDEENRTEPKETNKPEEPIKSEEQNESPQNPKAPENPSSSEKSSTNNSSKSVTDNERETLEGSPSDTPSNGPRAPLSKRLSQDPDPVWVLNLLNKLEKQFMSHYIDAMAEFKVRWDLDDSIILDTMISELRDEVSRRIQSSIQREMRKIQSRAGKGGKSPRPPKLANISQESTMTDKRRRMLKVMKNQSVKTADSLSDEETAGEFSDQRSEDEYCPCDACVRKKMAARPFKKNPLAAEAPVMMEFDLLKILQLKKGPSTAPVTVHQPPEVASERMVVDEEARNLEVVNEEEEENETKENIKADIVLEETIVEEDEEAEEEKDEGDEQDKGENSEEQEEGTTGEEAEQEETSEDGEDEAECTCQSGREEDEEDEAEETSSHTGDEGETGGNETGENEETRTADEEEESDKETAKEASSGEVEEESGEDSAGENVANEESTLVEEIVDGNVSASADDEDDGTGEGESHENEKGEESEDQEGEVSEEDKVPCQSQNPTPTVCVTEGEEADAEDSDDSKRQTDTGAEESGREETGGTGEDEETESGEEEAADEDMVEEFKPEEDSNTTKNKKEGSLPHQFTKTSVESQSGSMEEVGLDPSSNLLGSKEVPKAADGASAGGGVGHRRSRSPARVKRRKPKESDLELDDF